MECGPFLGSFELQSCSFALSASFCHLRAHAPFVLSTEMTGGGEREGGLMGGKGGASGSQSQAKKKHPESPWLRQTHKCKPMHTLSLPNVPRHSYITHKLDK